jgi:hypothetical protein
LGKSRHDDNIKVDLKEIGWEGVGWIHVAVGRDQWLAVVNTIMNRRVSYIMASFLTS